MFSGSLDYAWLADLLYKKPEEPVELDGSERARLINMRLKKERAIKAGAQPISLWMLANRLSDQNTRRTIIHWFLRAKVAEEQPQDEFYEDILMKLTTCGRASNLLEVEKMWAHYAIRQTNAENTWIDSGVNTKQKLLEQQLRTIENKLLLADPNSAYTEEGVITDEAHLLTDVTGNSEHCFQLHDPEKPILRALEDKQRAAYTNHGHSWIFEFEDKTPPVELRRKDHNKHRIRRAVGF